MIDDKIRVVFCYKDKKEKNTFRKLKCPPPLYQRRGLKRFKLDEYTPQMYGRYIVKYKEI